MVMMTLRTCSLPFPLNRLYLWSEWTVGVDGIPVGHEL